MKVDKVQNLMRQLPPRIGNLAERHFKESFRKKGWMDAGLDMWPPRKSGTRGSLMVVSGALKRSIHRSGMTANSVTITAGDAKVPYAAIHNEGGITHPTVTARMRKFAWARAAGARTPGEAASWKALATTRKGKLDVKIPKRKYMGRSAHLDKMTLEMIIRELNTIFQ